MKCLSVIQSSSSQMIKVRFHLGRKNYLHWQVKYKDSIEFYSPDSVSLLMHKCYLKNRTSVARKIHEGAYKSVCAWIECEDLQILPAEEISLDRMMQVCYNPKVAPYWRDEKGSNIDGKRFESLVTKRSKVFVKGE